MQSLIWKIYNKMMPFSLKLCNSSAFRDLCQLWVNDRGMFWAILGCALKQLGTCSDLTSIHIAGVHFEWDIQWILNPWLVLISALMHKKVQVLQRSWLMSWQTIKWSSVVPIPLVRTALSCSLLTCQLPPTSLKRENIF